MRAIAIIFKLLTLTAVVTAAAWLIWKFTPPFAPGLHESASASTVPSSPALGRCPVFPPDNVWNTPVDNLPRDPRSDAYIASIGPLNKLHPDFGSSPLSGIPFSDIPPNTRPVPVSFGYVDESDPGPYPIPPHAPIEGGPESYGDRHVLLIEPRLCTLYELFNAHPQADGSWQADSGAVYDMSSNRLRPNNMGSADAAGLPIFPGLVRYDEVARGQINHALRFTIPHTQAAFIWPARHKASHITDLDVAPMGQRFRLRAAYDISRFSPADQVILTALKRYGMILADNGGSMFLSGTSDKRWDDADLHILTRVHAEDFEAVDESRWATHPNSAQVDR